MHRPLLAVGVLLCASCASTPQSTFQTRHDRTTLVSVSAGYRSL